MPNANSGAAFPWPPTHSPPRRTLSIIQAGSVTWYGFRWTSPTWKLQRRDERRQVGSRRLDQHVRRRHLSPELGLDGAQANAGGMVRARRRRDDGCRCGSSSSPSRADRRSLAAMTVEDAADDLDHPLPPTGSADRVFGVHALEPVAVVASRSNPMHWQQF